MNTKKTLILGSLLFISSALFSQEMKKSTTTKPAAKTTGAKPAITKTAAKPAPAAETKTMSADEQNQKLMDYMSPGKMHQMLAQSNGQWKEDLTFWMAPGAQATRAQATCTNSMILGGRFQESLHTGEMMGMPFEGRGIVGYDNTRNIFQSTWVDNMGTGTMTLEGKYDEATKSVTLKGVALDGVSGKMEHVREVLKFTDDKNQFLEMYWTKDGKEFKSMEIVLTKIS